MDGSPITADDFIFNWKFQDGKDCSAADCPVAGTTGYDAIDRITGTDNGKTVTCVQVGVPGLAGSVRPVPGQRREDLRRWRPVRHRTA